MVEKMTPGEIDRMPAGQEMNALIESEIYQSLPLTDEEWELLRTAWSMTAPGYVNSSRPFKVPHSEPHYETGAMYRLGWAQDFSADRQAAEGLVSRMRRDGWFFTLYDTIAREGEILKVAKFSKIVKNEKGRPFTAHEGEALAETDALAISRAALKAFLALNERGEK